MRHLHSFGHHLSRLLRESDTATLEFVIGLLALSIGVQFITGLIGLSDDPAILEIFPFPIETLLAIILTFGSVIKIIGAVTNNIGMRAYAALATSGIWFALLMANLPRLSIWVITFLLILGLQSAWIYIRLSLIRKRGHAS